MLVAVIAAGLAQDLICPRGPKDYAQVWLDASYDPGLRPPPCKPNCRYEPANLPDASPNRATDVELVIYPVRLGSLDTRLQSLTADYEMNVLWNDPRLAYNASCLTDIYYQNASFQFWMPDMDESPEGKIWTPKLLLENMYPSTDDTGTSHSHVFRVTATGLVWWQFRASMPFRPRTGKADLPLSKPCHSQLRLYPPPALNTPTQLIGSSARWTLRTCPSTFRNATHASYRGRPMLRFICWLQLRQSRQWYTTTHTR